MKKSMYLLITLAVGLSSCDKTITIEAKRAIINKTPYNIQISIGSTEEELIYNINELDTLILEGICNKGAFSGCRLGWSGSVASASITFNNDKIQKWDAYPSSCVDKAIGADPIGGGCYGYVLTIENGVEVYTYEITQEDYDNAEDIGG